MRVVVEGQEIQAQPGMTVAHALRLAGVPEGASVQVVDAWGNALSLEGELTDGQVLRILQS